MYSLAVLESLQHARKDLVNGSNSLGPPARIQDCCDAFLGTSVGAVIAAGLAVGMKPADLLSVLKENGPIFFPGPARPGYFKSRYSMEKIETVVRGILGELKFSNLDKPCFVSSVDVETGMPLLVGGYKGSGLHFSDSLIWEAVIASISAPTYFPFQQFDFAHGDAENPRTNGWLADGGISANAPELIALPDLATNFAVPIRNFFVLSIGTTSTLTQIDQRMFTWKRVLLSPHWYLVHKLRDLYLWILAAGKKKKRRWGVAAWFANGRFDLIELILKAQVNASVRICRNLLPQGQYLRIDTYLPADERIALDDPNKHEELVRLGGKAVEDALASENPEAYKVALFVDRRNTTHSAVAASIGLAKLNI